MHGDRGYVEMTNMGCYSRESLITHNQIQANSALIIPEASFSRYKEEMKDPIDSLWHERHAGFSI